MHTLLRGGWPEGLRTICDLRRVAGVCCFGVLGEAGFQLCDAVVRGAVTNLVFAEEDVFAVFLDGDGGDFVVEPALLLGVLGSSVGFDSVCVLFVAGDVEVSGDVF